MSNVTPKNVCYGDVFFGVRMFDREITIPIRAYNLPSIKFASADFVIPVGYHIGSFRLTESTDGVVSFGVSLDGPHILELSKEHDVVAKFKIGTGIDSIGHHEYSIAADFATDIAADTTFTQGHLGSAEIPHDIISTAFFNRMSFAPEMQIEHGIGFDVHAMAEDATGEIMHNIEVGMFTEAEKSRKRKFSDLEDTTLADLNSTTLQELYWIDTQ